MYNQNIHSGNIFEVVVTIVACVHNWTSNRRVV